MRKSRMFNEIQLYIGWDLPLGRPSEEPVEEFYQDSNETSEEPSGHTEKQGE
ncbi:hypothetical protein VDG1235_4211 [Verrucomicrobiia bacterium DG1235]|nr:hypothetical protein VDG1235_4211 [Verrucomicrobiae bacterium DG1235]